MRRKRTHPPVLNACAVHLHLQAGGTRREPATASSTVFPLAPHESFAYATLPPSTHPLRHPLPCRRPCRCPCRAAPMPCRAHAVPPPVPPPVVLPPQVRGGLYVQRVLVQYVPRDSIHILCHYTTLAYTPRNPLSYTVSYVGAPPLILVYPYEYLMQGATSVHRGALMYSLPISANFTMYVLLVV